MNSNNKSNSHKATCYNFQLSVSVKMSSGSEYCLELDLAHTIVPAKSSYKVLRTKVLGYAVFQ